MNSTEIQKQVDVAGEETNPTIGRLIWYILSIIICLSLVIFSEKLLKKEEAKEGEGDNLMTTSTTTTESSKKDKHLLLPWFLSVTGGIMLWQGIGESSWHYGLEIDNNEGEKNFVNFPRIESFQGIPILVVFVLLFLYGYGKLGFGVESCLGAFLGNWYGHVCILGTYPFALACHINVDMKAWDRIMGTINFVIFGIIGFYIMFLTKKSKQTKYLASVSLFIAFGVLVYGVILAET
ncbi:hypothetical protein BCR36DRAFT_585903 [Piromyces finnis]|uniref:Uncharacterized protein n=1 Tax=Piromyces finnis TaxID=1754191 RepID=A0A1Y1V2J2_9FUNG|nr:hypothetical protein BCR36DRAFT_585903 [Piromyces finnis]|eukprot:ORX45032.1 hypothetical protein BCR36DRAFT_585903 [Piromyces finnis]